jgi:hypothetical protein
MDNPYELAKQLREVADSIEKEHSAKLASQFECDAEVLREFEWTLVKGSSRWSLRSNPKGEKAQKLIDQLKKATQDLINTFDCRMQDKFSRHFWVSSGFSEFGPGFFDCPLFELCDILDKLGPLVITNLEEVAPILQKERDKYESWRAGCNNLLTILGL